MWGAGFYNSLIWHEFTGQVRKISRGAEQGLERACFSCEAGDSADDRGFPGADGQADELAILGAAAAAD
jgi:hypothetical protein